MRLLLLHILAVIFFPGMACSQDSTMTPPERRSFPDSGYVLQNIILRGNALTKDFVILREMSLKPGSRVTERALQYDRDRIYSLGLFNNVQLWVLPSVDANADILVDVHERWYIFPYPIFGIRERDWSKVYYGAGLLHNNFRGRNEKLSFSFVLGYNPSVALSYRNPFLDESGKSFLETQLSYSSVRNRSQQLTAGESDFDERHFFLGITLGKRFGIEHAAWIFAGYEIIDLSEHTPVRTLSPSGTDRYPIGSIGYSYDTRDLAGYPSLGTFVSATVTTFGLPADYVHYVRYGMDLRRYVPLTWNFVLTGRMFADVVAAGALPSYHHVFFGYGERIRGHFKDILEGENIFGASSEIHVPLIPTRYFTVGFLPSAFSVWKFGVTGALFGDAGTTWYRGEPLALDRLVKGYGAGIDVLLPYDAVFRFEYAWNERRRGEFIFEAGKSF